MGLHPGWNRHGAREVKNRSARQGAHRGLNSNVENLGAKTRAWRPGNQRAGALIKIQSEAGCCETDMKQVVAVKIEQAATGSSFQCKNSHRRIEISNLIG